MCAMDYAGKAASFALGQRGSSARHVITGNGWQRRQLFRSPPIGVIGTPTRHTLWRDGLEQVTSHDVT